MMGLIPFPQFHFYRIWKFKFTPISHTISKNGFKLWTYFNVADNSDIVLWGDPDIDSFFKLRSFLDTLPKKILRCATATGAQCWWANNTLQRKIELLPVNKKQTSRQSFYIFVWASVMGIYTPVCSTQWRRHVPTGSGLPARLQQQCRHGASWWLA